MEKKKSGEWTDIWGVVWKTLAAVVLLFVLGLIAVSGLIYQGIVPMGCSIPALYAVSGAAAFGAAAFSVALSSHQRLLKAMLAQTLFLILLLLAGMLIYESETDWLRLGITAAVVLFASAAAVALFGGRKKKKFKKNASIRLKKK